jgi:DNA-binding NarL/FixJ family response regulator
MHRNPGEPIRVILLDDHDIIRRGFKSALDDYEDIVVVADCRYAGEMLDLVRRYRPDVVLVAVNTDADGLRELLRPLCGTCDETGSRIGMLIRGVDCARIRFAVQARVSGYLAQEISADELAQSVRSMAQGYAVIGPETAHYLLSRFTTALPSETEHRRRLASLSEREIDVLVGVGAGMSNQGIADELHLSVATVKSHVSNVLDKLGLANRVHAALLASHLGLVERLQLPSAPPTRTDRSADRAPGRPAPAVRATRPGRTARAL